MPEWTAAVDLDVFPATRCTFAATASPPGRPARARCQAGAWLFQFANPAIKHCWTGELSRLVAVPPSQVNNAKLIQIIGGII